MSTAIIGGSGFADLPGLEVARRDAALTPYGAPSAPLLFGRLGGREVVFISRHGAGHSIAPHRVNYRANLWALKQAGAARVVALAAVGGIAAQYAPGTLALPHQLIDYTWGRAHTFFDCDDDVRHIDFAAPYDASLRTEILAAARRAGAGLAERAVHAVTQGPRLESAAEIDRLERDGAGIVGMTGMPEAALARELCLPYAAIAMVINPAAGRAPGFDRQPGLERAPGIDRAAMEMHLRACAALAMKILMRMS
ncbi:MAG: S-methyl-5'-thioinosine phosphorylase [Gammaproteobacteria bacterium]